MSTELDSGLRLYHRRRNLTMFPGSVDPRAKMKNAGRQGPFSRSLDVSPSSCRALRLETSSMGLLKTGVAAMAQRKAVIEVN